MGTKTVLTSKVDRGRGPECPPCISPFGEELCDPLKLLGRSSEGEEVVPCSGADLTGRLGLVRYAALSELVYLFKASVAVVVSGRRDGGIVRGNIGGLRCVDVCGLLLLLLLLLLAEEVVGEEGI